MGTKSPLPGVPHADPFDVEAYLDSAGLAKTIVAYPKGAAIFTQGAADAHVLYVRTGSVKLSVTSRLGREAIVGMPGPGEFFGEGCLAGQSVRTASATALADSSILLVEQPQMVSLLHREHALSDRLIAHALARNTRIEADLVDQLFNSSEKRLARMLLILARHGQNDQPVRPVPVVSQETLAEMIGTTRSRVNFFMRKFERLGHIDYKGGLTVHRSLLGVLLHD